MSTKAICRAFAVPAILLVLAASGVLAGPATRPDTAPVAGGTSQKTTQQLFEDHQRLQAELTLRLIHDFNAATTSRDKAQVAWMMGEARCEYAIPLLVENIDLEDFSHNVGWSYVPCVEALGKITPKSYLPLLERLGNEQDVWKRRYAVWALRSIGGNRAAADWLQQMIELEKDPEKIERYKLALTECERQTRDSFMNGLGAEEKSKR